MIQMALTRLLRRSKDGAIALMVLSTGCAATSWPMPSSVRYNPDFAVHSRLELDQVRMELGATRLAAPTEAAWASPLHNIQFLTSANGEVANTLRSQGNYIGAIRVAGGVVVAADSVIASRSERERARKWAWEIQGSSWQSLGFVGLSRIHFAFAGLAQTYLASTAAAQGDADFARQSTALDQSVARRNSAEESARSAANHASMVATQAMMHASNVQANAGSNSTETARARALASQALSTATTNDSLADQITSAANSNSVSTASTISDSLSMETPDIVSMTTPLRAILAFYLEASHGDRSYLQSFVNRLQERDLWCPAGGNDAFAVLDEMLRDGDLSAITQSDRFIRATNLLWALALRERPGAVCRRRELSNSQAATASAGPTSASTPTPGAAAPTADALAPTPTPPDPSSVTAQSAVPATESTEGRTSQESAPVPVTPEAQPGDPGTARRRQDADTAHHHHRHRSGEQRHRSHGHHHHQR